MPKSKGRKRPSQKKRAKGATPVAAPKATVATIERPPEKKEEKVPPATLAPEKKTVAPRYPYLGRELLKIAIVSGIVFTVLAILAVILT